VSYWGKARFFQLAAIACVAGGAGWADPVLSPSYPGFSLVSLGSVAGVPISYYYAGLSFNGSKLLLGGGDPTDPSGDQSIYSVAVNRNGSGQITALGSVTLYATVPVTTIPLPGNILAGGMIYAPDGTLLYTTTSQSYIGQYSPTSSASSLTSVGNIPLGGLEYLPNGQLVMSSTNGNWYTVTLTPSLNGLYSISVGSAIAGVNAPADTFVSFPGSISSVLVGDSTDQELALYGLDSGGDPTGIASQVVGGNGDPIGYGLARDPLHSNSYLFTTGNNQIWELTANSSGTPEPSPALLAPGGIAFLLAMRRRATYRAAHRS
jgi:MYXO-CTERM domain-containing protein